MAGDDGCRAAGAGAATVGAVTPTPTDAVGDGPAAAAGTVAVAPASPGGSGDAEPPEGDAAKRGRVRRAPPPLSSGQRRLTAHERCSYFCPRQLREAIDRRTGHHSRFRPGEHIKAAPPRSMSHHGIYTGTGTVIHYCSDHGKKESGGAMAVRETCFHIFIGCQLNAEVEAVEYGGGDCFDPAHTVRLARQSLGRQEFSLLDNNCEHFASWCKKGVGVSEQVNVAGDVSKASASVAGGAASGGLVAAQVGARTVPVLAGSRALGAVAQGVLQKTALGNVLAQSGVATSSVVVPATAATVTVGLAVGGLIGGVGYGCWAAVRSLFGDEPGYFLSFCVLRDGGAALHLDADDEGLPVYGPVRVDVRTRAALAAWSVTNLPGLPKVGGVYRWDHRRKGYEPVPDDLQRMPRVCSIVLVADDTRRDAIPLPPPRTAAAGAAAAAAAAAALMAAAASAA